jgi:hypothetical protein
VTMVLCVTVSMTAGPKSARLTGFSGYAGKIFITGTQSLAGSGGSVTHRIH